MGFDMIAISFGLSCIGFFLLSLSMKRHFRQVSAHAENFERWKVFNRSSGYICIGLAAWPCVELRGWWIGMVLWISILAAAAFLQALFLTCWPRQNFIFAGLALLLVLVGALP